MTADERDRLAERFEAERPNRLVALLLGRRDRTTAAAPRFAVVGAGAIVAFFQDAVRAGG